MEWLLGETLLNPHENQRYVLILPIRIGVSAHFSMLCRHAGTGWNVSGIHHGGKTPIPTTLVQILD
jgi:hypothetical protein